MTFPIFSLAKSLCSVFLVAMALVLQYGAPAHAAGTSSVYIEDLTWQEMRDRLRGGTTIAIIPTGGTEQNGPHMIIGKHNLIVRYTAGEIARKLGNAVVAPVIAYVPEGRISPPEGHMQFPGTISLTQYTFEALLEDAARSLKQHGFKLICFIGDNGGNQDGQRNVAARLTQEWYSDGVRVLHVGNYYSKNGQDPWVESMGIRIQNPGAHAGFIDTSELMAIHALGVHDELRGVRGDSDYRTTGAMGDSTQASANYGRKLLNLKIEAALEQIQSVSGTIR